MAYIISIAGHNGKVGLDAYDSTDNYWPTTSISIFLYFYIISIAGHNGKVDLDAYDSTDNYWPTTSIV